MSKVKKHAQVGKECAACGACAKVCPLQVITVYKGLYAVIEESRCVGCGKCAAACPANVITVKEVQAK
jgi:MinD superfamily P-loop ATPase